MAPATSLVTDPFLCEILQTSASARTAALSLLHLVLQAPPAPPSLTMSSSANLPLARASKHLNAKLSFLRGQNRRLAQLVRQTKQHTSNSRSEIDTLHLSLQNLYYESRHLIGEIAACESFPHVYLQLHMPSEEEFLERYPELRETGEGELMAARIEQEFVDRSGFEEQRKELLGRKMELMRENAKRKEDLGRLDADLERFIEAAKPIQKTFEKEW